jgi:serine/threonine protein kinase
VTLAAGTRIGKYVVREKIAEGGMAEIFLGSASGPGGFEKDVVLKQIRGYLSRDPQFVEMFIAEARLASRFNHPNIVQIFDFGQHADSYYLAMEYVPGYSLWDVRRRAKELFVPMPATLVGHLGAEIARGLHYAHRLTVDGAPLGLVHRDVTPHNILLSMNGAVKLADFGIARAGAKSTAPGVLKGKLAYMAPEQARGEEVDARTDVFALGIVLWEMLTGGRLFDAENDIATLRAVQERAIAPPRRLNPELPEALDPIVMKALERDPANRHPTAQALERALGEFVLASAKSVDDTDVGAFLRQLFGDKPPHAEAKPQPLSQEPSLLEDVPEGALATTAPAATRRAPTAVMGAPRKGEGRGPGTAPLPERALNEGRPPSDPDLSSPTEVIHRPGRPTDGVGPALASEAPGTPQARETPPARPSRWLSIGMRRALWGSSVLLAAFAVAAGIIAIQGRIARAAATRAPEQDALPPRSAETLPSATPSRQPPESGSAATVITEPLAIAEPSKPPVRRTGKLHVQVRPWAYVLVGRRKVEAGPDAMLTLPEGRHRIRLENPDAHWSEERVVDIQPGGLLELKFSVPNIP